MQKRWIDPPPITIPAELTEVVGDHPLIAETLVRRGITDAESAKGFLDPAAYDPASPFDLPDMDKAVERIERAIQTDEPICVWGDFDVDGQTSSALLVSALRGLGADVTYYLPHRINEGHGVHIPKLGELIDNGASLIITCDTGIAAHEAINYANSRNVDVIVTDHHQLPPELPDAYACVNPQRLPEGHPLRTLPGVGCAFKLIEALYRGVGLADDPAQWLDLVALGIVADVAEQVGDARYLLQLGLRQLRRTSRIGLQVMMNLANINPSELDEQSIGFGIAPRLNAVGRLGDANVAVELLTTDDLERARILAQQLEGLNNQRKHDTEQIYQAAVLQTEQNPRLLDYAVLVLAHANWHSGVVGIVANRLVEQFNRPVILLTIAPDGTARGSARSVEGVDITAAITTQAGLLEAYGGHTMAAGMSLQADKIDEFRRGISRAVQTMRETVDATPTLTIDGYLLMSDISLDLVESLSQLAPFGAGNPPLTLASRKLTLHRARPMGRESKHQRLTVVDENGVLQDVVWWNADLESLPPGRFDLAYTLRANDWQGKIDVQVEFVDARAVDEEPQEFAHRAHVKVIDYRDVENPLDLLKNLDNALIWNEGDAIPDVETVRRIDLHKSPALAIWTAPPGAEELRATLEIVNPAEVYLFGVLPGADSVNGFLQRFNGVVKYALNQKNGETSLIELAGAMAHRESTIRAGLDWMTARGHITVEYGDDGDVKLSEGGIEDAAVKTESTARVATLLQETAAYRAYFRQADKDSLINARKR
jgi:single-stranded-DNA-specific exonuclease